VGSTRRAPRPGSAATRRRVGGPAEVGEVVTAINAANAAGGSYQGIFDGLEAQSRMLRESGARAESAGHRVTAHDQYLRAAEYLAEPLFFVLGTSTPAREPEVFSTLREYWEEAGARFDPKIEQVAIPYEGSHMPGYLVKAPGSGRRPTVIVNNGSAGQSVETYSWGGRAAAERGWNALLLEGPGQGAMLFERKIRSGPTGRRSLPRRSTTGSPAMTSTPTGSRSPAGAWAGSSPHARPRSNPDCARSSPIPAA